MYVCVIYVQIWILKYVWWWFGAKDGIYLILNGFCFFFFWIYVIKKKLTWTVKKKEKKTNSKFLCSEFTPSLRPKILKKLMLLMSLSQIRILIKIFAKLWKIWKKEREGAENDNFDRFTKLKIKTIFFFNSKMKREKLSKTKHPIK